MRGTEIYGTTKLELAKPAALLFDKIVVSERFAAEHGIPREVTFYPHALTYVLSLDLFPKAMKLEKTRTGSAEPKERNFETIFLRSLIEVMARQGFPVIPLFQSDVSFAKEFPRGDAISFQAVLNNLPVVEPSSLDWEQVLEFRRDAEAVRKYRALRRWMQEALSGRSVSEATDIVGITLDDYQWTLRKHGLKTKTGAISEILSAKTLATASAAGGLLATLGQPIWALIASGSLVISRVAIWVAERRIEAEDLRHGQHAAIAAVHEISELMLKADRKQRGVIHPTPL